MAPTHWHSDLRMAPLDTNAFVTFWLPLRAIRGGAADSGLLFARGSHRDFALPFWHDLERADLSGRGYQLRDTGVHLRTAAAAADAALQQLQDLTA
jgi:hypothetical protein